ncbi:MAG: GTP-binding protein, partial [Candidatus Binataceae bacterium]
RMLNFFAVGERLALVDLPGYGYAKMSQTEAAGIAELMRGYLVGREDLTALVMLVDARRGPGPEELGLAALLKDRGVELVAAATKCDKLRSAERGAAARRFEKLEVAPLMCSAFDGEGIDELRRRILRYARITPAVTCPST